MKVYAKLLYILSFVAVHSQKTISKIPKNCLIWFDGCNNCIIQIDKKGNMTQLCTKKACPDPKPAAKCMKYAPTSPPTPAIPKNCKVWFDGCNTCQIDPKGKKLFCTRKFCKPEDLLKMQCKEFHQAPTSAPTKAVIPKNCKVWFDGCNICGVNLAGMKIGCTKKYCPTMGKPKCQTFHKAIPKNCRVWFDGCNTCLVKDGKVACTRMFCPKELEPKCNVYVDSGIPTNCKTYFDGCNTCQINRDGTVAGCTKKVCPKKDTKKCTEFYKKTPSPTPSPTSPPPTSYPTRSPTKAKTTTPTPECVVCPSVVPKCVSCKNCVITRRTCSLCPKAICKDVLTKSPTQANGCPIATPESGTSCMRRGLRCEYSPVKCCGKTIYTTIAECSLRWRIRMILFMCPRSCTKAPSRSVTKTPTPAIKCPVKLPAIGSACPCKKGVCLSCKYSPVTCCGKQVFTAYAICQDGKWSVRRILFMCPSKCTTAPTPAVTKPPTPGCVVCFKVVPKCETKCKKCVISPQTCSSCSKAICKDATIPPFCKKWFDGCNTCSVKNGLPMGCTKKSCPKKESPKCEEFEKPIIPLFCKTWFDGCNDCTVKDRQATGCTRKVCGVVGQPKCKEFHKLSVQKQAEKTCKSQQKYLGMFKTPAECAVSVAKKCLDKNTFMFSSKYPTWGCRCCSDRYVSVHKLWDVYVIDEAVKPPTPSKDPSCIKIPTNASSCSVKDKVCNYRPIICCRTIVYTIIAKCEKGRWKVTRNQICPKCSQAPTKPVTKAPTKVERKEGQTCGYVFGVGHVGKCAAGLECKCVNACANPLIADAPSTCVNKTATEVPTASPTEKATKGPTTSPTKGCVLCFQVVPRCEKECKNCVRTRQTCTTCPKAICKDAKIPPFCKTFFDGCNNCSVKNGVPTGCTKKACPKYKKPKCLEFHKATIPLFCKTWFDGCNVCLVQNRQAAGCTKKVCEVLKKPECLAYHKLSVNIFARQNVCPQESNLGSFKTAAECSVSVAKNCVNKTMFMFSPKYPQWGCRCCSNKLVKHHNLWNVYVIDEASKPTKPPTKVPIPPYCQRWFDGCNICTIKNGKVHLCTSKFCAQKKKPKCLEFQIPPNCITWFDGCNTCSVVKGKLGACTLMYCKEKTTQKCIAFQKAPTPVVSRSPTKAFREEGQSCGYVFGLGNVGKCASGLECKCVNLCADRRVADAPPTCVKTTATEVPTAAPTEGGCVMCAKVMPRCETTCKNCFITKPTCSSCSKAICKDGPTIPPFCKTWFDGCNYCNVLRGVPVGCTKKICNLVIGKPKCEVFHKPTIPLFCKTWFDGCNDCIVKDRQAIGCTKKVCGVLGQPKCKVFHKLSITSQQKKVCKSQQKNLGNFKTPADCALSVAKNCVNKNMFMFSSKYTVWGCRCCTNSLIEAHNLWNVYVIDASIPPTSKPATEFPTASPTEKAPTTSPTKGDRQEGQSCGYVFGLGNVGMCTAGLECKCVNACANPKVLDAPSTCVKKAATEVPTASPTAKVCVLCATVLPQCKKGCKKCVVTKGSCTSCPKAECQDETKAPTTKTKAPTTKAPTTKAPTKGTSPTKAPTYEFESSAKSSKTGKFAIIFLLCMYVFRV